MSEQLPNSPSYSPDYKSKPLVERLLRPLVCGRCAQTLSGSCVAMCSACAAESVQDREALAASRAECERLKSEINRLLDRETGYQIEVSGLDEQRERLESWKREAEVTIQAMLDEPLKSYVITPGLADWLRKLRRLLAPGEPE